VFALTQFAARGRVDLVPMSEDDMAFLEIDVEMPKNVSFEESEAWFLAAEKKIEVVAEELGIEFYIIFHQREFGEIQGALAQNRESKLTTREVTDRLLEILPELPGTKFHTGMASQAEEDLDLASETVRVYGDDAEQLRAVVVGLKEVLLEVPGVFAIKRDEERAPNELALQLNRDLAQRQGVNPTVLAGVVGYALRGQPLSRVYLGGRDIPVRLRFEEEDRNDVSQLGNFTVPTQSGGSVALGSLVEVKNLPTASTIFRANKQTSRSITLELEEGSEEEARAAIYSRLAQVDLPEGISFGPRAARGAQSDEARNLQFAALLSIVFVYLLMGFLFESFMLPLSILITIPLANLGVTWAHILADRDMDFLGLVGVVILIGVVVNNGIVLLDYVRRLRERGYERTEALLLATQRRFRPIMMTALTTICGMVPLTLGEPLQMGLSYKSFGLTLIGGMVTSSLLTLLVVPVFYTLFEDARGAMGRAALAGLRREAPSAEGTEEAGATV
jgi:HAE1 family hydrophobic/amphiphilic exporter-1